MIVTASWILTYFFHGVVCGSIVTALRFLPTSPVMRCRLMRMAIVAPFATSAIAIAVDRRALSVTPVTQDVDVRMIQKNGSPPVRIETRRDSLAETASSLIVLAAAIASSLGLLRLMLQRARVSRQLSTRVSCDAGRGLVRTITTSDRLNVPLALRGGEICVPSTFASLGVSEQTSVLLHERAHIARKDPEWLDAARSIAAVFWWQPFNIHVARQLEIDSELAADELALSTGADGPSLVRALSQFAATLERGSLAGAALIRHESPLVERARLILNGAPPARWDSVSLFFAMTATALLLLAPRVTAERGSGAPSTANRIVEETNIVLR
jgi:beta-lactamase regulating signal transducer with metallopeptidase domain